MFSDDSKSRTLFRHHTPHNSRKDWYEPQYANVEALQPRVDIVDEVHVDVVPGAQGEGCAGDACGWQPIHSTHKVNGMETPTKTAPIQRTYAFTSSMPVAARRSGLESA